MAIRTHCDICGEALAGVPSLAFLYEQNQYAKPRTATWSNLRHEMSLPLLAWQKGIPLDICPDCYKDVCHAIEHLVEEKERSRNAGIEDGRRRQQ